MIISIVQYLIKIFEMQIEYGVQQSGFGLFDKISSNGWKVIWLYWKW